MELQKANKNKASKKFRDISEKGILHVANIAKVERNEKK